MKIPLKWCGRQVGQLYIKTALEREKLKEIIVIRKSGVPQHAILLEGVSFGRIFLGPPIAEDCFTIVRNGATYSHHARRCAAYGPADGRLSACCI